MIVGNRFNLDDHAVLFKIYTLIPIIRQHKTCAGLTGSAFLAAFGCSRAAPHSGGEAAGRLIITAPHRVFLCAMRSKSLFTCAMQ